MKKLLVSSLTALAASVLLGETFVWQGASGGSWNEPSNWTGGVVPNADDATVQFDATGGLTVNIASAVSAGEIVVTGGQLTLTGAITDFFTSLVVRDGGVFNQTAGDTLANNCAITLDNGKLIGNGVCDYVGPITLRNGGEVSGYAYLVLDYPITARVTADAGSSTIACPIAIGSQWGWNGGNTARTLDVTVTAGAALTVTGEIRSHWGRSGDYPAYVGGLVKTGGGRLTLGPCDYQGETVVKDGVLELSASTVLKNVVRLEGGTLDAAEGASPVLAGLSMQPGAALDLGGRTLTLGDGVPNALLAGNLSVGRLVKNGAGTLTVLGENQDIDALDVNAGTFAFGGYAPLLHYTFDDPENLGRDSGTLGRALTVPASASSVDGPRGGAVKVVASAGLTVATAGLPAGRQSFTICVWIKKGREWENGFTWGPAEGTPHKYLYLTLFGAGVGTKLGVWAQPEIVSSTVAPVGEFHHYAVVADFSGSARELRLYIDGVCAGSQTLADWQYNDWALNTAEGSQLMFGNPSLNDGFDGAVDDIQFFDLALPADAIRDVMNQGILAGSLAAGAVVRVDGPGTVAFPTGTNTLSALSGRGTLHVAAGAKVVVDVAGGETASVGTVLGDGSVEKTGTGTFALTAATRHGATVEVAGGALAFSGGSSSLADHVVCRYAFDATDPGADASGHGYGLKSVGLTWAQRTSRQPGTAYFDGANGYLTFDDAVSATAHAALPGGDHAYTVSFWFNPDPGVAWNGGFFSWGEPNGLQCTAMRFDGDRFNAFNWGFDHAYSYFDRTAFITPSAPEGWHHVLLSYGTFPDGVKGRRLYIDGVLQGSGETYSGSLCVQTTRFNIGSCHENSSASPFCGYMDDFILLDCAVSSEQVLALMAGLKDASGQNGRCALAADTAVRVASGEVDLASVAAAGPLAVTSGSAALAENTVVETDGASVRIGPVTLAAGASVAPGEAVSGGTLALPTQATVRYTGTVAGAWDVLGAETLTGTAAEWLGVGTKVRPAWRIEARAVEGKVRVSAWAPGLSVIVR